MSVEELEILRKKARNIIAFGIIISIVLSIGLFIDMNSFFFSFFILLVGILITAAISIEPKRKFSLAFKQTFVLKPLQSVFTNLVYEPEKGIEEKVIKETGMMGMGDRYSSNDFISGKYKEIGVVQADVHIEEERSSGDDSTTWVTLFKGRWLIFDFNKTFKANIQVCQEGFYNAKLRTNFFEKKYERIMMEDQMFNDNFRTYAQDEHEAFYILTPALMEKIKALASNTSGKLLFCFVDSKLHIGIQNNHDSFEHGVFNKIDVEKASREVYYDIKLITNFIDELDLDNDLFRKEV